MILGGNRGLGPSDRHAPLCPSYQLQIFALLAQGQTAEAEAIFQAITERGEAEDIREAATAYRHLGALAFPGDTEQALDAYRRASGGTGPGMAGGAAVVGLSPGRRLVEWAVL